jgi:hypothetical protein
LDPQQVLQNHEDKSGDDASHGGSEYFAAAATSE